MSRSGSYERLAVWASADPDDLAALLYASLLEAGASPQIAIERTGQGTALAIEVRAAIATQGPVCVARIAMAPIELSDTAAAGIAAAIEFAGRCWNRKA